MNNMTLMAAWHIVSANRARFYKMRKTPTFKGYVDADTEAEVICFKALKEMDEKNNAE